MPCAHLRFLALCFRLNTLVSSDTVRSFICSSLYCCFYTGSTPTKPDLRPSAEFREGCRCRRGDGSSGTNHASLDALSTHEELDILKVEHSHTFSSQTCALQDLQTQEKDLHSQFEVAVWEKAESDIMLCMS
ncbi:uncharacterized protein F5891DRAFT_977466 [Suillus fuscotomentosus]|uniref:Uncharacterized protein n=1 Tax=Suillus fuscotomentosus TaxID=1912939 RepID=A0AAD4ECW4_9AGAM|nr:uncharacterized protein F5891DRAFT_977466 [Suillus fuscotomentosus]KAG1903938.1 hypothetical protein F5891DRAFT_977466 [Suillus fuscotomentosus]